MICLAGHTPAAPWLWLGLCSKRPLFRAVSESGYVLHKERRVLGSQGQAGTSAEPFAGVRAQDVLGGGMLLLVG